MNTTDNIKIPLWRRWLPKRWRTPRPVVAVLRLSGAIGAVSPLAKGLNFENLQETIDKAFDMSGVQAVALAINSPGGSPVQSALIYGHIRARAEETGLPVYAFAEDVAASGGYMLALAGDEIHASPMSIIGSIGVVSAGFGLDRAIDKLGIDRRVYTAGKNKMALDPFQPENPEDVERLKKLQRHVHDEFKAMVSKRRGSRIDGREDELFTGEFWSGKKAAELGLIDGLADLHGFMREKYGKDVRLKPLKGRSGWLKQRLGLRQAAELLPESWTGAMLSTLETRALWARFGL